MPNDNPVREELFAVELEVAFEMRAPDQEREPMTVIGPHLLVWDLVERRPEWNGFGGLTRLTGEIMSEKNRAMQAVAVAKLEMQFAALLGAQGDDPQFLPRLAQRGAKRRLAGIDFAARAIDFPRAEATLLVDEKDFPLADDKEEIGPDPRLPACPVDHLAR